MSTQIEIWERYERLTNVQALHRYIVEDKEVYAINTDNTESLITSLAELHKAGSERLILVKEKD